MSNLWTTNFDGIIVEPRVFLLGESSNENFTNPSIRSPSRVIYGLLTIQFNKKSKKMDGEQPPSVANAPITHPPSSNIWVDIT